MKCYSDMSIWNASIRKHQNISTSHTLVPPEETVWWLSTNIGSASEVPGSAGWWPGEARVAMGEQPGSETGSSILATSRTLTHLYRQQPATTCAWPPCCLQSPQEPPHPVLAFIVLYMFLPPCVCVLRMLSWKLLLKATSVWFQVLLLSCNWHCTKTVPSPWAESSAHATCP